MAVVLCFGDSLTYGFDPVTGGRFLPADRWPEAMGEVLGTDHTVIVEALPGRTTVFDSPFSDARSGRAMLAPSLESHAALDLVILMLGTNDLQTPLALSARHSAARLWTLIDIVNRSACAPGATRPASLVIALPPLVDPKGWLGIFYEGREAESLELVEHFAAICGQTSTPFFAAGDVVEPSRVDGIHLDPAGQRVLGHAIAKKVSELLA